MPFGHSAGVTTMNDVGTKSAADGNDGLNFVFHPSFTAGDAESLFAAPSSLEDCHPHGFMPDDMTRDLSRRMHYAAWRVHETKAASEGARRRRAYIQIRNAIVVGNRKLIFKAVQKWVSCGMPADDLVGECQLVLIKAVGAYNPWLGIRFSTYAFTCLIRSLSRLAQRHGMDRLSRSSSLESLPWREPAYCEVAESADSRLDCLGQLLQDDAAILTAREKLVISRRYLMNDHHHKSPTLEQVGHDLGLSKERVRQLQNNALLKLRGALAFATPR